MSELTILNPRIQTGIPKLYKNGVELEKGAVLTVTRIEKNRPLYEKYCNFFSVYPDLFIDLITPTDSNFHLFDYQRIFLRACMRFRYHYCTAPRAFSKSFTCILALILKCIFQPRSKLFICAPGKEQSAKIAKEKIVELFNLFPILKKEIVGEGNFGKDYVTLTFRNGSVLDIVGALDTTRGGRRSGGLIDEVRRNIKNYTTLDGTFLIVRGDKNEVLYIFYHQ